MGKVKNWVTQLCMALKHVHNLRIVHRDVKGSNMFITGATCLSCTCRVEIQLVDICWRLFLVQQQFKNRLTISYNLD